MAYVVALVMALVLILHTTNIGHCPSTVVVVVVVVVVVNRGPRSMEIRVYRVARYDKYNLTSARQILLL